MDSTIIAIDGGGTHTRGALFRNGKIIAKAETGTARVSSVGLSKSGERLLSVISDLCSTAGIECRDVDATVIGLAGVWVSDEQQRSKQMLELLARDRRMALNNLLVTSDASLAVEGAFGGGNGIVLIAGTGTIVLGKEGKHFVRCGGWGIEFGDEGSGSWIGREGLIAVARAMDGRGDETALTKLLAKTFSTIDLKEPRSIVTTYSSGGFDYGSIAPLVLDCAMKKDKPCLDIVTRACDSLVESVSTVALKFKKKPIALVALGGLLENKNILSEMVEKKLGKIAGVKVTTPKTTALEGAYTLGLALVDED